MQKTVDYKKLLIQKGNAVKRLVKEYDYYSKDAEKAETKLKTLKEQSTDEGGIKREENNVSECIGAKKQTYTSLIKFNSELEEVMNTINTMSEDPEAQKLKDEAKELKEYTNALESQENAKKIIEEESAANTK